MEKKVVTTGDGDIYYYLGEHLHRENDAPAIESANGDKRWLKMGKYHREGAPAAILANGDRYWYIDGKPHREDGAAIEYALGNKQYFLNGEQIYCKNDEEFLRIVKLKIFL